MRVNASIEGRFSLAFLRVFATNAKTARLRRASAPRGRREAPITHTASGQWARRYAAAPPHHTLKSRSLLHLHARRTLSFAHALSFALSRPQRVYIGNLDPNVQKDELIDICNAYGKLQDVWVARNPPGFAFVTYEDTRDAEDCVLSLIHI